MMIDDHDDSCQDQIRQDQGQEEGISHLQIHKNSEPNVLHNSPQKCEPLDSDMHDDSHNKYTKQGQQNQQSHKYRDLNTHRASDAEIDEGDISNKSAVDNDNGKRDGDGDDDDDEGNSKSAGLHLGSSVTDDELGCSSPKAIDASDEGSEDDAGPGNDSNERGTQKEGHEQDLQSMHQRKQEQAMQQVEMQIELVQENKAQQQMLQAQVNQQQQQQQMPEQMQQEPHQTQQHACQYQQNDFNEARFANDAEFPAWMDKSWACHIEMMERAVGQSSSSSQPQTRASAMKVTYMERAAARLRADAAAAAKARALKASKKSVERKPWELVPTTQYVPIGTTPTIQLSFSQPGEYNVESPMSRLARLIQESPPRESMPSEVPPQDQNEVEAPKRRKVQQPIVKVEIKEELESDEEQRCIEKQKPATLCMVSSGWQAPPLSLPSSQVTASLASMPSTSASSSATVAMPMLRQHFSQQPTSPSLQTTASPSHAQPDPTASPPSSPPSSSSSSSFPPTEAVAMAPPPSPPSHLAILPRDWRWRPGILVAASGKEAVHCDPSRSEDRKRKSDQSAFDEHRTRAQDRARLRVRAEEEVVAAHASGEVEGEVDDDDPVGDSDADEEAIRQKERQQFLEIVSENGLRLEEATSRFRNDKEVVLAAVRSHPGAICFAGPSMRSDLEVLTETFKHEEEAWLENADPRCCEDKAYVLFAVVHQSPHALQYASEALQDDAELVFHAVRLAGSALQHASLRLRESKGFIINLLQDRYISFKHVHESLRKDKDVVFAACRANGNVLHQIGDFLRHDTDILAAALASGALEAFSQHAGILLGFAEFMLAAVKLNGQVLRHAKPWIWSNRRVVLAAVKQDGLALEYADNDLRADRHLLYEAVKCDPQALRISPNCSDMEIVFEAVKQDGTTLAHASEYVRNDKDLVLTAVRNKYKAFGYASPQLKQDPDVRLLAERGCPGYILIDRNSLFLAAVSSPLACRGDPALIVTVTLDRSIGPHIRCTGTVLQDKDIPAIYISEEQTIGRLAGKLFDALNKYLATTKSQILKGGDRFHLYVRNREDPVSPFEVHQPLARLL